MNLRAFVLTRTIIRKERALQITTSELESARASLEQSERRVRDLEEQMQNDDKVERLETQIRNIQERSEELEHELSKIHQVRTAEIQVLRHTFHSLPVGTFVTTGETGSFGKSAPSLASI